MTAATSDRPVSAATERSVAFVAAHRGRAEAIGRDLAELVNDPDALASSLAGGWRELADPEYREGQQRVAPGIGPVLGVRWPLIEAVRRGFREATRRDPTSPLLFVADRLYRVPELENRWFAFGLLERLVADDPERTWQLLRRASRDAGDWITVDALAHPVGKGILNEPYRWAELEQLIYAPSRWERRLVGSTVATIPHIDHRRGRTAQVSDRGLFLVGELIGDAEPDVQKALAWALRSVAMFDVDGVTAFCEAQADMAARNDDGHRAWVIRDVVVKLDEPAAAAIRSRLAGVRRRAGAASTSRAAETAARFGDGRLGGPMPEPPLA